MEKIPTAEQLAKYKSNAKNESFSADVRAKFQSIVDKFENVGEAVVDAVEQKKERKPRTTKTTKKVVATKQTKSDIESAKAEIKKRTGKTEEECESIVEEYRTLRTKSQERKKKEVQSTADNKDRVDKLKKDDKIISGTNEKTADAVIETTTKDVAEKIVKELDKIEQKAEVEATKEVKKEMPKESTTEQNKVIAEKTEEKVKEIVKTKTKRILIDTSDLLTSIAESLGKFDKDSQKLFLIKLRSDIDKLLTKFSLGGATMGATQTFNITQSNLSSSSVNPTMFGGGGGVGGNRAKSVTHKINGKDRKFPIKDAWRREHNSYNKSEKHETPLSQRKFVGGGGVGGRQKDTYNKLVASRDNEFYFVDYIFNDADGFKGATGTIVSPVSKEYYEYATSEDGISERFMDAMGEDEWLEALGLDREDFDDENEMIKAIEDGIYDLYRVGELNPFEEVYYRLEEQLRELPQFSSSEEYPIFEVIGGGRSFGKDSNFDKIYDQDLYNKVRKIEEFAKGGMTEHGLKEGDTIIGENGYQKDEVYVLDRNRNAHYVNLDKGQRFGNGGILGEIYGKKDGGNKIDIYYKTSKGEHHYLNSTNSSKTIREAVEKYKKILEGNSQTSFAERKKINGLEDKFGNGGGVDSMMRSRRGM
jgi:chemotaxis protein histidine kinase CheA